MKLTHRFARLTPEKRPQDPNMDGTGLRFETMEIGSFGGTALKAGVCSRASAARLLRLSVFVGLLFATLATVTNVATNFHIEM